MIFFIKFTKNILLKLILVFAVFTTLSYSFPLKAQSSQIDIISRDSGEVSFNSKTKNFALVLLALLIGMILGSGILSSAIKYRKISTPKHAKFARNLFLYMQYKIFNQDKLSSDVYIGYLRELSINNASFVSLNKLEKGLKIRLFLNTLPGFPDSDSFIDATVKSSQKKKSNSYMVYIDFSHNLIDNKSFDNLKSYLFFLQGSQSK